MFGYLGLRHIGPHFIVALVPTKLQVAMFFLHPPSAKKISVSIGVLSERTGKLYGLVQFVLFFLVFHMFGFCLFVFG